MVPHMLKRYPGLPVILLCAILGVIHIVIVLTYAVNLPDWDDYDAVLKFTGNFIREGDFMVRLRSIFSQHNEHRIAFDRMVIVLSLLIGGGINFKALIIIGNVLLFALFFLIAKIFEEHTSRNYLLLAPVPFLFFNLGSYENYLWAMASLQNIGVILFALLSTYLLFRSKKVRNPEFVLSLFFALVATYTSGNGMLSLVTGLAALIVRKENFRLILVWAGATVLFISLYFYGYSSISQHPGVIDTLISKPDQLVSHFFVLVGRISGTLAGSTFLGFALVVTFLFLIITRFAGSKSHVLYFCLFFLFASCCLTSLSRAGFGVHQAMAVRYTLYSSLIIIFLYFLIISETGYAIAKVIPWALACTVVALYVYADAYRYYMMDVRDRYKKLVHGAACFYEGNRYSYLSYPDQEEAKRILDESRKLGIYAIPFTTYGDIQSRKRGLQLPAETNNIAYAFEFTPDSNMLFIDNSWAYVEGLNTDRMNTFVVLLGDGHTYIFDTYKHLRPDVTAAMNAGYLDFSGFSLLADQSGIEPGRYRVGLLIKRLHTTAFEFTGTAITKSEKTYAVSAFMPRSGAQSYIDSFQFENDSIYIRGWAFLKGVNSSHVHKEIQIRSGEQTVSVVPQTEFRIDVSRIHNGPYDSSGFVCRIPVVSFKSGKYTVLLNLSFNNETIVTPAQEFDLNK